jgi:adenylate cyclase class 2
MNTEIEAKLKVRSLVAVEKKLSQVGAVFLENQDQQDIYFDDKKNRLKNSDSCLRLRTQKTGNTKTIFVTCKGPKQKDNFKKRREIDLQVDDFACARQIFSFLGFSQRLVVGKKRRLWKLDDCLVALDSVKGLGFFVEIEGPNDRGISRVQKKIGLAALKHIPKSYACLVEKNLKS